MQLPAVLQTTRVISLKYKQTTSELRVLNQTQKGFQWISA